MTYATAELIINPCGAEMWSVMWWTRLRATASRVSHLTMCQFEGQWGTELKGQIHYGGLRGSFCLRATCHMLLWEHGVWTLASVNFSWERIEWDSGATRKSIKPLNQLAQKEKDSVMQMVEVSHYSTTGQILNWSKHSSKTYHKISLIPKSSCRCLCCES